MQSERAGKIFGDREDPRVRLIALFGGSLPESGQPPAAALQWASEVSSRDLDEVTVVRDLRRAEPKLTLKAATFLARHFVSQL